MKRHFSFQQKSVAFFLSFSLTLFNSVSFAIPPPPSLRFVSRGETVPSPPWGDGTISIPDKFGRIEESFVGNSDKTIIYIQDAHDSLEAQENIAKLIHYFVEHYGVTTVFEEGYEGPVPTDEYFGFIKDPEIKEKVSYFLLDKLRIGGAEYAHINRDRPLLKFGPDPGRPFDFKLIGADSIKLHLENIEWYQKNAQHEEETKRDLKALSHEIVKLADQHFPKDLKEWMKLKKRFDEKQIPLSDYLKRILSLRVVSPAAIFSRYSNIALLLQAENTQDKEILEKVKTIEIKALFEEIDRLENDFANSLLSDERDRRIFQYHKALSLLKKLNGIQLSSDEFLALKTTLRNLDTQTFVDFIVSQTRRPTVFSKRWEENIRKAMKFYKVAATRDENIKATLEEFSKNEESICILIFGGFHKDRIKEILRQKNFSYFIVSPKITNIDSKHRDYYKRLMSIGYLPFEVPLYVREAARAESRFLQAKEGGILVEAAFRSELRALSKRFQRNPGLDHSDRVFQLGQELPKIIRSEVRRPPEFNVQILSDAALRDNLRKLLANAMSYIAQGRRVNIESLVGLAQKINPKFATKLTQQQLRAAIGPEMNQFIAELRWQVFFPADELLLDSYTHKQQGQTYLLRLAINSASWQEHPYLGLTSVWTVDADPKGVSVPLNGITVNRFAFSNHASGSRQATEEYKYFQGRQLLTLPIDIRLSSLMTNAGIDQGKYSQYFNREQGFYEELRHTQDYAFTELHRKRDLRMDPLEAEFLLADSILKPDSILRTYYQSGLSANYPDSIHYLIPIKELAGQLGGSILQIQGHMAAGRDELAYMLFLRYLWQNTQRWLQLQQEKNPRKRLYSDTGRIMLESLASTAGIYTDINLVDFQNQILQKVERVNETPHKRAERALNLLKEIYDMSFWTDTERLNQLAARSEMRTAGRKDRHRTILSVEPLEERTLLSHGPWDFIEDRKPPIDISESHVGDTVQSSPLVLDQAMVPHSGIISVDPNNPNDFRSIQEAINASHDGDTIEIQAGTYQEDIIVSKGIHLIGNSEVVIKGKASILSNAHLQNITFELDSLEVNADFSANIVVSILSDHNKLDLIRVKVHEGSGAIVGIKLSGSDNTVSNSTIDIFASQNSYTTGLEIESGYRNIVQNNTIRSEGYKTGFDGQSIFKSGLGMRVNNFIDFTSNTISNNLIIGNSVPIALPGVINTSYDSPYWDVSDNRVGLDFLTANPNEILRISSRPTRVIYVASPGVRYVRDVFEEIQIQLIDSSAGHPLWTSNLHASFKALDLWFNSREIMQVDIQKSSEPKYLSNSKVIFNFYHKPPTGIFMSNFRDPIRRSVQVDLATGATNLAVLPSPDKDTNDVEGLPGQPKVVQNSGEVILTTRGAKLILKPGISSQITFSYDQPEDFSAFSKIFFGLNKEGTNTSLDNVEIEFIDDKGHSITIVPSLITSTELIYAIPLAQISFDGISPGFDLTKVKEISFSVEDPQAQDVLNIIVAAAKNRFQPAILIKLTDPLLLLPIPRHLGNFRPLTEISYVFTSKDGDLDDRTEITNFQLFRIVNGVAMEIPRESYSYESTFDDKGVFIHAEFAWNIPIESAGHEHIMVIEANSKSLDGEDGGTTVQLIPFTVEPAEFLRELIEVRYQATLEEARQRLLSLFQEGEIEIPPIRVDTPDLQVPIAIFREGNSYLKPSGTLDLSLPVKVQGFPARVNIRINEILGTTTVNGMFFTAGESDGIGFIESDELHLIGIQKDQRVVDRLWNELNDEERRELARDMWRELTVGDKVGDLDEKELFLFTYGHEHEIGPLSLVGWRVDDSLVHLAADVIGEFIREVRPGILEFMNQFERQIRMIITPELKDFPELEGRSIPNPQILGVTFTAGSLLGLAASRWIGGQITAGLSQITRDLYTFVHTVTHEFVHMVDLIGLTENERGYLYQRADEAVRSGFYNGTYAGSLGYPWETLAEVTTFFADAGRPGNVSNYPYNRVLLEEYDPITANFVNDVIFSEEPILPTLNPDIARAADINKLIEVALKASDPGLNFILQTITSQDRTEIDGETSATFNLIMQGFQDSIWNVSSRRVTGEKESGYELIISNGTQNVTIFRGFAYESDQIIWRYKIVADQNQSINISDISTDAMRLKAFGVILKSLGQRSIEAPPSDNAPQPIKSNPLRGNNVNQPNLQEVILIYLESLDRQAIIRSSPVQAGQLIHSIASVETYHRVQATEGQIPSQHYFFQGSSTRLSHLLPSITGGNLSTHLLALRNGLVELTDFLIEIFPGMPRFITRMGNGSRIRTSQGLVQVRLGIVRAGEGGHVISLETTQISIRLIIDSAGNLIRINDEDVSVLNAEEKFQRLRQRIRGFLETLGLPENNTGIAVPKNQEQEAKEKAVSFLVAVAFFSQVQQKPSHKGKPESDEESEQKNFDSRLKDGKSKARSESRQNINLLDTEKQLALIDFADLVNNFSDSQIKEILFMAANPRSGMRIEIYNVDRTHSLGKFFETAKLKNLGLESGGLGQGLGKLPHIFDGTVIHLSSMASGLTTDHLKKELERLGIPQHRIFHLAYHDDGSGTLEIGRQDISTGKLGKQLPEYMNFDRHGRIYITDPSITAPLQTLYSLTIAFARSA